MEKTQKNYSFKECSKGAVFFDLETTGLDVSKERIVQLAVVKINISGEREEKKVLVNPTIPIPKEASDVHGITDEMVKDKPVFKQGTKSTQIMCGHFEIDRTFSHPLFKTLPGMILVRNFDQEASGAIKKLTDLVLDLQPCFTQI